MIGNLADARAAYEDAADLLESGSSRHAYLIDNVVYKVEHSHEWQYNVAEYDNIKALSAIDTPVKFPEVALYEVEPEQFVIAMEYIDGKVVSRCSCDYFDEPHTPHCMTDDILEMVSPYLDDSYGGNVIIDDYGDVYIIDLGEFRLAS